MAYCEKKGLYCSEVARCEQNTDSCDLQDRAETEIVFTAEDLERMYKESAEEQELKSFDKLLAELAESGTKLIKDYHTATKSCEDLQKEVYSIRAELTATRDLLESFEQGNIVAPELQDKFINYLTDLSKKPGSKKTAIDKAIKWIKNNCK
jgi:hypothetical protein